MRGEGKEREKLGTPCPSCKTNIPFGTMRCPRCKEWNFSSGEEGEQEVVRLSDARISIVPRLPTLHPEMDKFFGGGSCRRAPCSSGLSQVLANRP